MSKFNSVLSSLVLLPLALTGCGGSSEQVIDELQQNRQVWESLNADFYQFEYQVSCFCTPESIATRNVLVLDNQIRSLMNLETGQALKQEDFPTRTIDELFSLIALEESRAESLVVRYHPQMGYPTFISVDGSTQIADDEYSLAVGNVQLGQDIGCTTEARPGLILNLVDENTQEPINCDATITAQEDDFIEVFHNDLPACEQQTPVNMLYSRDGFYEVSIERPGYNAVQLNDVGIARDICHVVSNALTIELEAE